MRTDLVRERISLVLLTLATLGITAAGSLLIVASAQSQSPALNPQQLLSDETGYPVDVSPDGRFAMVVTQQFGRGTDERPSRLLLRDLLTTETIPLAAGASSFGPGGRPAAVFSTDATRVAYGWTDKWAPGMPLGQVRTVLRVTGRANGVAPRTLIGPDPAGSGTVPHGWSPDGTAILVLVHSPGANISQPTSLGWLSVADGTIRAIKTLEPWRNGDNAFPRLSPDGTSIAYSVLAREGSTDRWVYVIDAQGRNERAVASLAGSNTRPVWTPDSARVVFVNSIAGRNDLYAVSARVGQPGSEPERIQEDFPGEPLRISQSGDLFYIHWDDGFDQMIAERGAGGVRIVQAFSGAVGTWSKGNKLAFIRRGALVLRSLDGSPDRTYLRTGLNLAPPRWVSDDSELIVYIGPNGDGGRPGGSFYRVNALTGAFTWMFPKDTPNSVRSFVGVLSPDDKTFYLAARASAQAPWTRIVGVDLASRVERTVATLPEPGVSGVRGLAIAPDGSALAIYLDDGAIMTVRTDGRDLRELRGPSAGGGSPDAVRWSRDGREIVFVGGGGPTPTSWRMLRISAMGGQAEVDGLDSWNLDSSVPLLRRVVGSLTTLDFSPDGSHIAFASRADQTSAIWMLPNVMSALRSVR